ncbi:hypothetical protein DV096_02635 [Bradymonadaceae bacterium TMQ3]|nr:hypothetical protein DV096_02635 [Bradymonadaceae bacterium TMQ3]TXC77770.1 hypothetical protein FRC91_03280 [Bradymonadales bacterium TMQ1]
MKKNLSVLIRSAVTFGVSALVLLTTLEARAMGDLLETLPGGHDAVMAVDFDETRDSPFFGPALGWMRSHPAVGPALAAVEETLQIEVQEDLEELVILSDTPPLNLAMLSGMANPMDPSNLDLSSVRGSALAARGDFEAASVLTSVRSRTSDAVDLSVGARAGVRTSQLDVVTLAPNAVLVLTGERAYRDEVLGRLERGERLGARFVGALARLGEAPGVIMMIQPNYQGEAGDASFAALSVRLKARVLASMVMTMRDDERARVSAQEIAAARQQALSNPLVAVFGLAPAAQNLAVRQQAADIFVTTSMTQDEAKVLFDKVMRIVKTSEDLEQGANPASQPASPTEAAPVPEDGVEADFN